mmetsp:Transcript_5540/g.12111  ORF Transcript_5540/g.12111 Transcript_5540/m.12111 type:complete len:371 (-) Transcript_5540:434-1546(-)
MGFHGLLHLFGQRVDRDRFTRANVVNVECGLPCLPLPRILLPLPVVLPQQRQHDRPGHVLDVHEIPRHHAVPQHRDVPPAHGHLQEQAYDARVRILRILSRPVHVEEPQRRGGRRGGRLLGGFDVLRVDEVPHEPLHPELGVGVRAQPPVRRRLPQRQQRGVGIAVDRRRTRRHHLPNGSGGADEGGDVPVVVRDPIQHLLRSAEVDALVLFRVGHGLGDGDGSGQVDDVGEPPVILIVVAVGILVVVRILPRGKFGQVPHDGDVVRHQLPRESIVIVPVALVVQYRHLESPVQQQVHRVGPDEAEASRDQHRLPRAGPSDVAELVGGEVRPAQDRGDRTVAVVVVVVLGFDVAVAVIFVVKRGGDRRQE